VRKCISKKDSESLDAPVMAIKLIEKRMFPNQPLFRELIDGELEVLTSLHHPSIM